MSRFWVETLGCPKNQVDSEKITGLLCQQGMVEAASADQAQLVVVNTCAFIEEARQESVETVLRMRAEAAEAELVVTGCMAERYGAELAEAMPEVDRVAGFGVPVSIGASSSSDASSSFQAIQVPEFDLLNLPRSPVAAPWAYVKIAEGCDRRCGYCAIPSFRGPQRSRSMNAILAEVDQLGVREVVLVAQDLAAYGRDQGQGERSIVPLMQQLTQRVSWLRLLYLYPSDLTAPLINAICNSSVPYFDLSLQHVSRPLLARMRRWGDGERFATRIAKIRQCRPDAVFRSNFIVGYPGETEADHDALLEFLNEMNLDWCGFFAYSPEAGTYSTTLDCQVPAELAAERLRELSEVQDQITAAKRDQLIGCEVKVLVDAPGVARSYREAPEIDGIIAVPEHLKVGQFHTVRIIQAIGPDLLAATP
ncbi:MAG: 30S ribosomal protein S12 methylthiotransferase RimO [Acidimicrobiia bacterium]|nr:30S ribosomal protein S12 methylthiotransferase RimO [Acidimicrobiia bacterium]MYC58168.1 30S ribosomal protein S12 methylthiotransferase RimO [Acidimicrobiia bacterium]MYI30600.1 30S ribosomal protein S12 methylthiotransferase RimO [Acidimicrobiia bacterium]